MTTEFINRSVRHKKGRSYTYFSLSITKTIHSSILSVCDQVLCFCVASNFESKILLTNTTRAQNTLPIHTNISYVHSTVLFTIWPNDYSQMIRCKNFVSFNLLSQQMGEAKSQTKNPTKIQLIHIQCNLSRVYRSVVIINARQAFKIQTKLKINKMDSLLVYFFFFCFVFCVNFY